MIDIEKFSNQTWEWLEEISTCTTTSNPSTEGVTRLCASAEHKAANNKLETWMKASGMSVRLDDAANLIGRYESDNPDAKVLMFGSHQDTVPNGGKYDGILGVILPIAMINYFYKAQLKFPFHIDIVAFSDEEGTRFQSTLLGSKAIAGIFDDSELQAKDAQGISFEQALIDFGCSPENITQAAYRKDDMLGYVELHIEQGPQLEAANLPVGVVTAITGIERHKLVITGKAGHAGTVPMDMRKDALVGAAKVIDTFDQLCKREDDLVGVVGKISNYPNGVNVIPQTTEITIELRSPNDPSRLKARDELLMAISQIMSQYNLTYQVDQIYEQGAVTCSQALSDTLAKAVVGCGIELKSLFSGAGHDGLAMCQLTEIAMLFMRCDKGISHHPEEAINTHDLKVALEVMTNFCHLLANQNK